MRQKFEQMELVQELFHFIQMRMRTTNATNESLHVAIGVNVNVLLVWKSLQTQPHGRVAHAMWGEKATLVP